MCGGGFQTPSTCLLVYSCSFALTPYDLNVHNFLIKNAMQWKEKKLEHDKKENNLTITPKWKFWNSSHAKNTMHSFEKNQWIDI